MNAAPADEPPLTQASELGAAIEQIDPIWATSRTSRQIYALGEVDRSIGKLLSCASSAIGLLALPQTDPEGSTLPQGEERSEQFVAEVTNYFDMLDHIHNDIRATLAHMRHARIVPSTIDAPPVNFVPRASGVGTPAKSAPAPSGTTAMDESVDHASLRTSTPSEPRRGLQEERVYRDAWRGVAKGLESLRDAQNKEGDEEITNPADRAIGTTTALHGAAEAMDAT